MKKVLGIVALLVAAGHAQTPTVTESTALAIVHWVDAVMHHVPGAADDPLMSIEKMSVDDRVQVRAGMDLFLTGLSERPARISTAAQKRIVDLGNDLARNPGVETFVDRAIMLHGDAAMVAIDRPEFVPSDPGLAKKPSKSVGPAEQVLERDGELVGTTAPNWNWAFARGLIALRPPKADTAFLATWFHATSTFLMSRRHYGDAQTQLIAAAVVVPKSATTLFDRAAYAELMGLPESQVLLSAEDIALQRGAWGTWMRGTLLAQTDAAKRTGVRPANVENAEAERLFRSVLDVDPTFVEARVRLARLLDVRGHHGEAAQELARALSGREHPDPVITFFAHLFAGRVDRALGELETATAHFQDALALFPNAQSALLAASQVAVLRSDVEGALASVRQLEVANASADPGTDPWWNYGIGLGRNANALLARMWAEAKPR